MNSHEDDPCLQAMGSYEGNLLGVKPVEPVEQDRIFGLEAEVERLKEEIRVKADDFHRERKALLSLLDEDNAKIERLKADNARLRLRLLSAAGDDLCRLSQEEIKAYTSGKVQIPPKEEFLPSCERFHAQIANDSGVLEGCLTLAQLIADSAKLEEEIDRLREIIRDLVGGGIIDIDPRLNYVEIQVSRRELADARAAIEGTP